MLEWKRMMRRVSPATATLMLLSTGCARHPREPAAPPVMAETVEYYAVAAQRAENILERLERRYGPHDPRLITPLAALSMIYFRQDRMEESDDLLERAWEMVETNHEISLEEIHFPVRYGSLSAAAQAGDRLDARTHLALGGDVDQRDAYGQTPLHHFAAHGDEAMVRTLLGKGATPGARDWQRQTAREIAEAKGHVGIVELLGRRQARVPVETAPDAAAPTAGDDLLAIPDATPEDDDFFGPPPATGDDFFHQPDAVEDDFFF